MLVLGFPAALLTRVIMSSTSWFSTFTASKKLPCGIFDGLVGRGDDSSRFVAWLPRKPVSQRGDAGPVRHGIPHH